MLVSSYITPKARKGVASGIEGLGLVALEPIAGGEVVAIKGGHIVTSAELRSLPERLQNSEIQIADGFHLAALEEAEYEPVMLFINHSCEPNVGFAGNIVLVAMHDISAGEELTTDYALPAGRPYLNPLLSTHSVALIRSFVAGQDSSVRLAGLRGCRHGGGSLCRARSPAAGRAARVQA